jgi:P27 family predicted phage terminase small subunit
MKGRTPSLGTIRRGARYTGDPPLCPDWLDPVARAEWERVAPELTALGQLTPVDVVPLATYCQTYSQWRMCEEQVRREGQMIPGSAGNMVLHPCARRADALMSQLRRIASDFGFTPAARSAMHAPPSPSPEDDDFDNFTSGAEVGPEPLG